nr:MAG TPA: hypothetical protein [Caudoviricetes sp.]
MPEKRTNFVQPLFLPKREEKQRLWRCILKLVKMPILSTSKFTG